MLIIFLLQSLWADFASEDHISIISTGGNTKVTTYDLKTDNSYTKNKHKVSLKAAYTYNESDNIRSAEKWNTLLRYDRELKEKTSAFLAEDIESDRFAGFARRYNSDIGLKRALIETDVGGTFVELGYRYVVEDKALSAEKKDTSSNSRLYIESHRKLNLENSVKLWVEYIQSFDRSKDYLINVEPSLRFNINTLLSLKIAYLYNYNNEPVTGNKREDYKYTTSLIAKF